MQGLPFFRAGDRADAAGRLVIPDQADGRDAEEVLAGMMSPPHFPIRPSQLRGDWTFRTTVPGVVELGPGLEGFEVEAEEVPHKGGPTFGFRVSDGRSSVAYIPDHCPTASGPAPTAGASTTPRRSGSPTRVDVLIHDAQLLSEELAAEASFGHAAAEYAVELGDPSRASAESCCSITRPDRIDDELDAHRPSDSSLRTFPSRSPTSSW